MKLFPKIHLTPLELLLDVLIKEYFATSYCIFLVSETPLTYHSPVTFTNIVPNEEKLVNQILNMSEMGCLDYFVLMREPQIFMTAFDRVVHLSNIRKSDRKIVFLPHDDNMSDENVPLKLFTMKESSFVANMLIITYGKVNNKECVVFDLVTHKFVGDDDLVKLPLYLDHWNSCNNAFENNANLFPHDMTNLHGKSVKVAGFTYKPYFIIDLNTSVDALGRDGIEVRLMDEFCRWINCTIIIVKEDVDLWGDIYENETDGFGVLGSLLKDRVDIGTPALYPWYEKWRFFDYSFPEVRTAVTCLAPAPKLLSSWTMPLMPFTWSLWVAVIFAFIFASIGLMIAEGYDPETHPFLSVFGMMVSQGYLESKVSWKIRSVVSWILIVGLILGSAYGAGLASKFTVPAYEPSIDTVQDIVDRRLEWGANNEAWTYSLSSSPDLLMKQLLRQFRTYSFEELQRKSFTRSMAFSIEKLPAGYFAIGEYLSKEALLDMTLMVEDFYFEQCVLMMRKSSTYTEKINQLIGRLHQTGLLLAWETQVALKHLDYKVQLEVRLSRTKADSVKKPLSASNLVGVFIIYITGVVISVLIFFVELLWYRQIRLKNKVILDYVYRKKYRNK